MTGIRTRFTAPDENHYIVRDYLRDACGGFESKQVGIFNVYAAYRYGYKVVAIDTRNLGGVFLDWLVLVNFQAVLVEVKTDKAYKAKGHSLKPNEQWVIDHLPIRCEIVHDLEGVENLFIAIMA